VSTATPCPPRVSGLPDPEIPCAPPTDPAGFIYPSYRAADTQAHGDERHLETSRQDVAHVSSAVGGSLSTLSFEETNRTSRSPTTTRHGGGTRVPVRGFSRASRRNLLRHFASINRSAFRAFEGKVFSLTLTYPRRFPDDPELCKRHLKAFLKRLERRYGSFAAFWRLGIQKRRAWHFHLLLFAPPSFGTLPEFRYSVASCWYEVTGKISEGHLRAGTNVEVVRKWKQATSYAEKYLAKEERFPEGVKTGRVWGRWNKDLLPVRWETVEVGLRDAYKIRRVYRKLARRKGSGTLRRMTVFVRHENVVRFLEYLGYRLE
jgi:hypothetical protein